jgi:hypothetical protein
MSNHPPHTHSHTHSPTHTFTHSPTHTHSLTHSHTHSLTHSHTHSVPLIKAQLTPFYGAMPVALAFEMSHEDITWANRNRPIVKADQAEVYIYICVVVCVCVS